jgi:hypothetical protein
MAIRSNRCNGQSPRHSGISILPPPTILQPFSKFQPQCTTYLAYRVDANQSVFEDVVGPVLFLFNGFLAIILTGYPVQEFLGVRILWPLLFEYPLGTAITVIGATIVNAVLLAAWMATAMLEVSIAVGIALGCYWGLLRLRSINTKRLMLICRVVSGRWRGK